MRDEDTLKTTSHRNETLQTSAPIEEAFWHVVGTLLKKWKIIFILTALAAVTSIVLSLLMPAWYRAETRLLSPEGTGTNPLSAALSSNISAAASAIFGGSGGDFFRYITILSSRTMLEEVVEEFDLIDVYDTGETKDPMAIATAILRENVDFPIDKEYEYLSIGVMDTDPQRAADIANFLVAELNVRNQELAAQDAANYRLFVENRYHEAILTLDSLKDASQQFQNEFGVFDLQAQTAAFLEQMAALRAEAISLEIEYEALREQYGPGNAQVRIAKAASDAAAQKNNNALQGSEQILPVAREQLPEVFRAYIDLEQQLLIQKNILELITPIYEQARFQEERKYEAVQVVDYAIPPSEKAKPRRSIIVIGATLSAFILVILFILAIDWWSINHAYLTKRIREATTVSK